MANLGDVGLVVNRPRARTFPYNTFTMGVNVMGKRTIGFPSSQFKSSKNTIIINNAKVGSIIVLYKSNTVVGREIVANDGSVIFYDLENTVTNNYYASDITSADKWMITVSGTSYTIQKLNSGISGHFTFG